MKTNYQDQIVALWTAFLLGILFHTQLGLMPLFHGQDVAHLHDGGEIAWIFWLMLVFFLLPLLAIIATTFTQTRKYRVLHFWLTVVYSVLNFLHVVMDLFVTPIAWYQIALMVVLFLIGLLLNIVGYQWLKHYRQEKRLSKGEVFSNN